MEIATGLANLLCAHSLSCFQLKPFSTRLCECKDEIIDLLWEFVHVRNLHKFQVVTGQIHRRKIIFLISSVSPEYANRWKLGEELLLCALLCASPFLNPFLSICCWTWQEMKFSDWSGTATVTGEFCCVLII